MASKGGLEEVPEGMVYLFMFSLRHLKASAGLALGFSDDDITKCAL